MPYYIPQTGTNLSADPGSDLPMTTCFGPTTYEEDNQELSYFQQHHRPSSIYAAASEAGSSVGGEGGADQQPQVTRVRLVQFQKVTDEPMVSSAIFPAEPLVRKLVI